jgi:ribosomal protein S18 acetylase RimI-like enzyme
VPATRSSAGSTSSAAPRVRRERHGDRARDARTRRRLALLEATIAWARECGLHKLSLSVFPHNAAGIALYRKHGFVEEGRRVKQLRRSNGQLWDLVDMGLLLSCQDVEP